MREEFENLLKSTNRKNVENLIKWLKRTDFFDAPASTRFHGAKQGGLLEHSLNVYTCLSEKMNNPVWKNVLADIGQNTIIITSLLHDVCKIGVYETEMRNKKVDGQWIQVPAYVHNDKFPLGHGEKSIYMIEHFGKMPLTIEETFAIRWHMGAYEGQSLWNTIGSAMDQHPLILALHEADMEATHIMEAGDN